MSMDNREAFETAYGDIDKDADFTVHQLYKETYADHYVHCAWMAWQAATAHNRDAVIDGCAKDIATEFYYFWHNQSGTNTSEGFDDWWKSNNQRFLGGELKTNKESCDHDWVSTHNPPVIIGGEVCVKCLSVRAAQKKEG